MIRLVQGDPDNRGLYTQFSREPEGAGRSWVGECVKEEYAARICELHNSAVDTAEGLAQNLVRVSVARADM